MVPKGCPYSRCTTPLPAGVTQPSCLPSATAVSKLPTLGPSSYVLNMSSSQLRGPQSQHETLKLQAHSLLSSHSNRPAQLGRKFQGPQVISASSASSQNWPLPAAHFPEAEGWVGWCKPVIGGWEAGFLSSVHQACKVNSGVWGEKRLYGGGDASETEHA